MAQPVIQFKINGQQVTPFVQWHAAQILVQRDVEQLTLGVELQRVKLLGDAKNLVVSAGVTPTGINVEITIGSAQLRGRVFPGNIWYSNNYVLINAQLDAGGLFARQIEGSLIKEQYRQNIRVLISPRVDKATMLMLAVAGAFLVYIVIKETVELVKDIADIAGTIGAGVGGPVSGAIMATAYALIRIALIALLVVAVVNLIKQIKDLLQRVVKVRGFRLGPALEALAAEAGFSISYMPQQLHEVWLIGGGVENFEAGELFKLAKQLTRSVLFVNGTNIKFIPLSGAFPQQYRKAHEEIYRHNADELRRRTIISYVRDVADEHTRNVVAAAEIDRQGMIGMERVDLPFGPPARAGKLPALDYVKNFIKILGVFKKNIGNVQLKINNLQSLLVAEREQFLPKLVKTGNPEKISATAAEETLQWVASNYTGHTLRKIYEGIKIPMNVDDFNNLMQQGFPGVRSMRWKLADNYAEIDYETPDTSFNLAESIKFV